MELTDKQKAEKYERMLERRKAYYQSKKAQRKAYQRDYYYRTRSVKKPRKEAPSE